MHRRRSSTLLGQNGSVHPERSRGTSLRGLCALLVAVLSCGCASRPDLLAAPTVVVASVAVDFPRREGGELAFSLRLPAGAPRPSEVSWELFLDGARFAAGIDGDVQELDGLFHVKSALAARHLAWREGEGWLDVVLQGEVDLGDGGERLRFRDRRELLVHGRPQLHVPRE